MLWEQTGRPGLAVHPKGPMHMGSLHDCLRLRPLLCRKARKTVLPLQGLEKDLSCCVNHFWILPKLPDSQTTSVSVRA